MGEGAPSCAAPAPLHWRGRPQLSGLRLELAVARWLQIVELVPLWTVFDQQYAGPRSPRHWMHGTDNQGCSDHRKCCKLSKCLAHVFFLLIVMARRLSEVHFGPYGKVGLYQLMPCDKFET